MIPITTFADRRVAIFGLGISGIAAARALGAGGAEICVWDDNATSRETAARENLPLQNLKKADLSGLAALILAPGVPLTHPEPHWVVQKAQAAGVEIIGDTELFFREHQAVGATDPIIAITGTNGKSTVAALTAHILSAAGRKTEVGGNIGRAILDLARLMTGTTYVIEFSSYQIDLTPTLTPHAAALLNIAPDHLDRHGTLDNYAAIKARIFAGLGADGNAIIGVDDPLSCEISRELRGQFAVQYISSEHPVTQGVYADDGQLHFVQSGVSTTPMPIDAIATLRGRHNWQNAAAAAALALSVGLTIEQIASGLRTFPGLAHRMEEVGRLGDVLFVNDSKATNADAAGKALASYGDIYWIAGGLAKSDGLSGLESYFPRITKTYLIGEATAPFASVLDGKVAYEKSKTLDQAVVAAARDAALSKGSEPVVLLSPACASFDQFPNFATRGEAFRAVVSTLKGIVMMERDES